MAEIATIARPYAEALFQSVGKDASADAAGWLDELASVAGNPQLLQFADNPKATPEQVFDVISEWSRRNCPTPERTSCAP